MVSRDRLKRLLQITPLLYKHALIIGKAADIRRGKWVEPELALVRELVRPGETAVDVGANYGLWSWHLARAVGARGVVRAFEPIPDTARAMRKILWCLGVGSRIQLSVAGAGEQAGRSTFRLPTTGSGCAVIAGLAHMAGVEATSGYLTTRADMVRLDDATDGVAVSLLKVDTEGAELFALRGAARMLQSHQPTVICEIGKGLLLERYGIDAIELVRFMAQYGYQLTQLSGGRLVPANVADGYNGNYVFVSARYRNRVADRLVENAATHKSLVAA